MSPIVSTIEIARPPGEVFAYVTDPTHFPEWQKDVVSVRLSTGPPGTLGSRFTTTRRIGGTMTQEVTEHSQPDRWAVRGVDGPLRPHATVTVEPVAGGSRVTFALDFEATGAAAALLPLVRRQAQRGAPTSYHNLKTLLERRTTDA